MLNKQLERSMQKLKRHDSSDFDIIYEATYKLVYYIIYGILKNKSLADDIMQEVYIKVYQKIDQYQENTSPQAWIARIARNLALNEYKRKQKETLMDTNTFDLIPEKTFDTPLIDLAVNILSEEEYMIVMMCVVERYRRREVAKILNLSTSGVTWKLNQALNKLKKEVEVQNENKWTQKIFTQRR